MENIRRICNPMVDLSKFTFNKNILNKVVALGFVRLEGWKSGRIENGKMIKKFLVFPNGVWFESRKVEE